MRNPYLKPLRSGLVWLLLPLLSLAFACGSSREAVSVPLTGTVWMLESMPGQGLELAALFPGQKPYLRFEEDSGKAAGNSGCNGYSAPYRLEGSRLSFGPPDPATLMYCGEGERHFKKALQQVDRWGITPNGKLFLQEGDSLLLVFTPQAVAPAQ